MQNVPKVPAIDGATARTQHEGRTRVPNAATMAGKADLSMNVE
ncbi:MAG TPA: hypothetical protein VFL79_15765 [Terriglobia bacterium]|nr:hypothetical protein [Terriglobia bacterium]